MPPLPAVPRRLAPCRDAAVVAALALLVRAVPTAAQPSGAPPPEPPAATGEERLATATQLIMAGENGEARRRLDAHLLDAPDDARATFLLALTHHRERQYAAAAPLMERALELDPQQVLVHHFLGWARLHMGQLDAAGRAFERHWMLQPGEPDTVFGLGLVAMQSGDDALAQRRFRETISLIRRLESADPAAWRARRTDLGKCHARLGELAFGRGDMETARRELERALEIDPSQRTAWYVLSRVHRRLGDDARAAQALDRFELAADRAETGVFRADDPAARAAPPAEGDPVPPGRTPTAADPPVRPTAAPAPDPASAMPAPPEDAPPFSFTDVTAASGVHFTTTSGHDPSTVIAEVKAGGLALLDHDRDGDLDILVPNGATLDAPRRGPGARLFENLGGLTFRDATHDAGLEDVRGWSMGVAAGDVDGDGWTDLFVACLGPDRLLMGGPGGRFRDASEVALASVDREGWSTAASFGDMDGDGDLDLLVARYIEFDPADPPPPSRFRGHPVPAGPRGLPPAADLLLENRGDGTFRDVSAASGLHEVPAGYGLAAAILDLDQDGRPELFIGNDSMPNRLLHWGPDGRLHDEAMISGLAISADGAPRATMGLSIGDLDDDGRPDVFTTNFAGEPNAAHLSTAGGFHEDAGARLALAADSRGRLGWGCAIEDLDHDGQAEVLVVNGHVYPGATRETMLADERQSPLLMRRRSPREPGDVRYERVLPPDPAGGPLEWLATPARDRTLLLGDLDGDGDLDAVIGGLNQPVRILRNDGSRGHWLVVEPGALPQGCRVEVRRAGRTWRRWIVSGTGYCSAAAPIAHVGLGDSGEPVDVVVTWSDGTTARREQVAVDQRITVARPGPGSGSGPGGPASGE